jgi:protein-tyrosine phosphatase
MQAMFRPVNLPADVSGKLYLHSLPGRYESFDSTVARIQMLGISQVVCLVPIEEVRSKSPAYAQALDANACTWQQVMFPILDFGVPRDRQAFLTLVQQVAESLRGGSNVLAHCGAGIGRTGTLAASVLVALGMTPDGALAAVQASGSYPERPEQLELVGWIGETLASPQPQELPGATVQRMQALIQDWEGRDDRRSIFLSCYAAMTANMLEALEHGRFFDNLWVNSLLDHFAGYYFDALAAYEQGSAATPQVWRLAHDAAGRPHTMVLQNLMLGVNAHINYDLVLATFDLLAPEWHRLSPDRRRVRNLDYRLVNRIIAETIDAVQDQVVEARAPLMDLVDKLMGPVDEWMISRLIAHWRDDVWTQAVGMVEAPDPAGREAVRRRVEESALQVAHVILARE